MVVSMQDRCKANVISNLYKCGISLVLGSTKRNELLPVILGHAITVPISLAPIVCIAVIYLHIEDIRREMSYNVLHKSAAPRNYKMNYYIKIVQMHILSRYSYDKNDKA